MIRGRNYDTNPALMALEARLRGKRFFKFLLQGLYEVFTRSAK